MTPTCSGRCSLPSRQERAPGPTRAGLGRRTRTDEARAKKAAVLGEVVEATNVLMAAKNTNKKNKNPPWKTAQKFKLRTPVSKLPGRKKTFEDIRKRKINLEPAGNIPKNTQTQFEITKNKQRHSKSAQEKKAGNCTHYHPRKPKTYAEHRKQGGTPKTINAPSLGWSRTRRQSRCGATSECRRTTSCRATWPTTFGRWER